MFLNNRSVSSLVLLSACGVFIGVLPASADCLSTPVTYNPGTRTSRFEERVSFLKEQIAAAESKGWITADQAAKFKADQERVQGLYEQAKHNGMTTADDVALEKEVTSVHHYLHYAIAGGHQPEKTLVAGDEPKAEPAPVKKSTKKRK